MNKRILISLSVIGAVAAIAIGGTIAYFSDVETSTGNTFTAGSIDLKVDYAGYYNKAVDGQPNADQWTLTDLTTEKFFNFSDLKPGDFGEGTISLHVINNDAWACMTVTPVANDDNGCTEPESAVDTTCEAGQGELAQALTGTIWADVCSRGEYPVETEYARPGDNIYQEGCDEFIGDGIAPLQTVTLPLADKYNNVFTGVPGQPLTGLQNYYIGVSWSLPYITGNAVQSDSYVADISFYTEQARNNPGFTCNND